MYQKMPPILPVMINKFILIQSGVLYETIMATFKKTFCMKRLTIICCSSYLFFVMACNEAGRDANVKSADSANNESIASPPPALDSATAMKNWQDYATPGDMHKMMASWDGKWTSEISSWEQPGATPHKSTATGESKMMLNGLYQESVIHGDMMGMPFEGRQTLAYDKIKKVFVSTWIDNMGSGIMYAEGPWDETTKTITFKGKMVHPGFGQEVPVRQVTKIVDENTQVMEMYMPGTDGKEFKTMEIVSKRSK